MEPETAPVLWVPALEGVDVHAVELLGETLGEAKMPRADDLGVGGCRDNPEIAKL